MPVLSNLTLRSAVAAAVISTAGLCGLLRPAPALANGNVYAGGGQVRPAGPVNGDFTAVAGKLLVDQPVTGDATLAGGSVDVRAPVGEDVRVAGGDVTIDSTIGGELFVAGGNVSVMRAAAVGRGATLYGGSIGVDGRTDGDLRATGRRIRLDGEVRGNARLVAEEIELGPKARIDGGLHYIARDGLKRAEGAFVGGEITRGDQEPGRAGPRGGGWRWDRSVESSSPWAWGVMSFLALLATAALFLFLVPRFAADASRRIQSSPWQALAAGFATVVAVPFMAVLLFVTLLGIPLGFALLALYPALMLAGFVVGVLFVGHMLAAAMRRDVPATYAGGMGYFALALLLTLLVATVPVVGGLVAGLLSLAGVGACVLELHGRRGGSSGTPPMQAMLKTPAEAG